MVLSTVTMMSVLSVPLMIGTGTPTMMTGDMAFRVNSYGDYPVAPGGHQRIVHQTVFRQKGTHHLRRNDKGNKERQAVEKSERPDNTLPG